MIHLQLTNTNTHIQRTDYSNPDCADDVLSCIWISFLSQAGDVEIIRKAPKTYIKAVLFAIIHCIQQYLLTNLSGGSGETQPPGFRFRSPSSFSCRMMFMTIKERRGEAGVSADQFRLARRRAEATTHLAVFAELVQTLLIDEAPHRSLTRWRRAAESGDVGTLAGWSAECVRRTTVVLLQTHTKKQFQEMST